MQTSGKSRLRIKKALLWVLGICSAFFVVFLVFVILLFKSPGFLDRVEQAVNARSAIPVEIGSLSIRGWGRIAVTDLTLRQSRDKEPLVIVPRAEVGISLAGLFSRNIDEIRVERPRILINLKEFEKGGGKQERKPQRLPLGKLLIDDAEIIVRNGKAGLVSLSALDLSVVQVKDHTAEIIADGILHEPALDKEKGHNFLINGTFDMEGLELKIKKASLSSALGPVDMKKGCIKAEPFEVQAELTMDNIDLEKTGTNFKDLLAGRGLTVAGSMAVNSVITVTETESKGPVVSASVGAAVRDAGFSDADATMAAEGITADLSADLKYSRRDGVAEVKVTAKAADFELLLGSFYGDFTKRKIRGSVKGKYSKSDDALSISAAESAISDMGAISMSGDVRSVSKNPRIDINVRLKDLANDEVFDQFVKETFQQRFTFLSKMKISGKTSALLSVKGTKEAFNVKGNIDVRDADFLAGASGLSIDGINMALPLDLDYPETAGPEKEPDRFGSLSVQNISWKEQQTGRIEAFPTVRQNTLEFREDIAIPVFGGEVRLRDVHYRDIMSKTRNLNMSIDISGLDLEQISSSFKIPRFSGRITGVIPRAGLAGDSLRTEGEIMIKVFGGEARVDNLSVNNLFGPVPAVRTSVSIREIDLGRLTDTLEFGHISGVLQGHVKDLVIARGQAQAFEAEIETVARPGISQKISVEAINKISILGTGSASAILRTGIYKLFDDYRYSKIGFSGTLRNDNLLLRGIEGEGGRQYLVKGGFFPPKVDVISYTQNISFQEMLKRLNRIKERDKNEKIRVE